MKSRLFILLALGFIIHNSFGQEQSVTSKKNQIDIFIGGSSIKKFYDATTFGIGLDHRFENLLNVSGQCLLSKKYMHLLNESDLYFNIDFLAGLYKTFSKINISINSGIGLALRNDGEIITNREESYILIALPIRLKINYLIKQRFSAGISSYINLNSGDNLYGFNLNFGYRF